MRYLEKLLLLLLIATCIFDFLLVCERLWYLLPTGVNIDMLWRIAVICGCGFGLLIGQFSLGGKTSYVGPSVATLLACEIARNDYIFNDWSNAWQPVLFLIPIFIFITLVIMAIDVIFIGDLGR